MVEYCSGRKSFGVHIGDLLFQLVKVVNCDITLYGLGNNLGLWPVVGVVQSVRGWILIVLGNYHERIFCSLNPRLYI